MLLKEIRSIEIWDKWGGENNHYFKIIIIMKDFEIVIKINIINHNTFKC